MKQGFKIALTACFTISLGACMNNFDYYSPYYHGEPHAPVSAPSDSYEEGDYNHQPSSTAQPTRQSHGAQYTRPARPSTSNSGDATQSSASSQGALSKPPSVSSQKPAYPAPPVVE